MGFSVRGGSAFGGAKQTEVPVGRDGVRCSPTRGAAGLPGGGKAVAGTDGQGIRLAEHISPPPSIFPGVTSPTLVSSFYSEESEAQRGSGPCQGHTASQ